MAVRSAMHRAGGAALTELLQFPVPAAEQRTIACFCGHQAEYRELRPKTMLTVSWQGGSIASLLSVPVLP